MHDHVGGQPRNRMIDRPARLPTHPPSKPRLRLQYLGLLYRYWRDRTTTASRHLAIAGTPLNGRSGERRRDLQLSRSRDGRPSGLSATFQSGGGSSGKQNVVAPRAGLPTPRKKKPRRLDHPTRLYSGGAEFRRRCRRNAGGLTHSLPDRSWAQLPTLFYCVPAGYIAPGYVPQCLRNPRLHQA